MLALIERRRRTRAAAMSDRFGCLVCRRWIGVRRAGTRYSARAGFSRRRLCHPPAVRWSRRLCYLAAMRPRCVVAERFWLLPRRDALSRKTPEGATGGQPYRKHNLLVIASKRRA